MVGLEELAPLSVRENARFTTDEPLFSENRMASTLSRYKLAARALSGR